MEKIKVYNGSGIPSTSYCGFVNFLHRTKEQAATVRKEVFTDYPNSVIVNGSDNWFDPYQKRPKELAFEFKLPLLAYYHDGISGLVYSGIVIDAETFKNFEIDYEERFGVPVTRHLTIYREVK